uniref:RPA43 OB domain-containing protein n=1 Tax=Rhodosorus marinus TaxID=101924 RepID=A0A7S3EB18_9RHOD|mmetsp:Transcript_21973/g.89268  ORF Transcript_21973/g.89268 Transcript_21973/m.89268 type:complete len:274 (+) Transcript_21973:747-1568(+)|eukprot:CAMPEP_0113962998 /NCGR_PEP_ID=MMETSP0011_2-20120614/6253_1 /TAXON_ID=101924 /ORGANISM="Rhodosorus marinus" /LENGTH=273 /DNA_ID=CAMNT_0000974967 /DNA_START=643 /DNA_END=1464 /DNA_ORIENTATION=- /assembly_acc=CAM_ASM_000156
MSWKEVKVKIRFSLPSTETKRAGSYLEEAYLSGLVFRYCAPARGVVVAYRNVELASDNAFVDGTSPYLHVVARSDLLVFSPVKGEVLTGVVTFVSEEFIGLKVYSTFYSVISRKEAPEVFVYGNDSDSDRSGGYWKAIKPGEISSPWNIPPGTSIDIGTAIRFINLGMAHTKSGLFQIKGSLLSDECQILGTANLPEVSQARKKRKSSLLGAYRPIKRKDDDDDPLLASSCAAGLGDPLAELRADPAEQRKSELVDGPEKAKKAVKRKAKSVG